MIKSSASTSGSLVTNKPATTATTMSPAKTTMTSILDRTNTTNVNSTLGQGNISVPVSPVSANLEKLTNCNRF